MSRAPLQIALAVMTVLLIAVGGPHLVERLRRTTPFAAAGDTSVIPYGHRRVALEVAGMSCATCASRVTERLQATPGVTACAVDPRAGRATVVCDKGVSDTTLVRAVTRASRAFTATIVGR
jgi:Cu+-exporting ATPase